MSDPLMIPLRTITPPAASGNTAQYMPISRLESLNTHEGVASFAAGTVQARDEIGDVCSRGLLVDSFKSQTDGTFLYTASQGFVSGDLPWDQISLEQTEAFLFRIEPTTNEIIALPNEGETLPDEVLDAREAQIGGIMSTEQFTERMNELKQQMRCGNRPIAF